MFRKFFGEPVGEIPCISAKLFDCLSQPDPFEPEKLQSETFEFIVEFPAVERVLEASTSLALDDDYNLITANVSVMDNQIPTIIPFSLNNQITLFNFPLAGKEHLPVIASIHESVIPFFDYCPAQVNVYYQRKMIMVESKGRTLNNSIMFAREKGLQVMDLGPRLLSNAIEILQFGTCSDATGCMTRINFRSLRKTLCFNNFVLGQGVHVTTAPYSHRTLGAAVGLPADAV